ncbi:hypothetical protein Q9966_014618 [Columba livia]|nr:hypothetical protein Q9966_014618 [Columba livia]
MVQIQCNDRSKTIFIKRHCALEECFVKLSLTLGTYGANQRAKQRLDGQAQVLLKQSQASITRKETRTAWIDCTTQDISDFQSAFIHWYRQIPSKAHERILYIGSGQPVYDDNSNIRKYSSVKKGTNLCSFSINDINSNDEGADAQAVPVQTPEIQRQVPGSSTSMVCRMSHEGTVHWYMQLPGEPPKRILYMSGQQRAVADSGDSRRFKVGKNPSEPVYSLTIHSLTPRDSGTYYYGQAQVLLKQSQASITRKETRTAWIDCTTQGISDFQSAHIHWYRQIPPNAPERILYIGSSQPVSDDNSNTRKYSSVKKGTNLCSFSINDINSNDEGADAQAVPVQTPEIQRQVPGSSTSMVCRMSHERTVHWYMQLPGEPPKRILYMSGQQRAVADSGDSRRFKVGKNPSEPVYSLTIHSLTPRDSGTYYYGQAQVLLKQSQASITRKETRTAWIDCTTQGISDFQSAYIHWYRHIPSKAPERILYIGSGQPVYDDNSNTRKYSSVKKGTNLCSFSINDINSNDEGGQAQVLLKQSQASITRKETRTAWIDCTTQGISDFQSALIHWYRHIPSKAPERILYIGSGQPVYDDNSNTRKYSSVKKGTNLCSFSINDINSNYEGADAQAVPVQTPEIQRQVPGSSTSMVCRMSHEGTVHWYMQLPGEPPKRILYMSGQQRAVADSGDSRRFKVGKNPSEPVYSLTIHSLTPRDSGTYYYGQAQVLLKQSQASITRKETRTAWIDCTTQGISDFQSAYIHWYRQIPPNAPERMLYIGSSQPVYDDNSNTRKYSSVKKGTNLCSFSINDINSNDEGADAQAVPVQNPEIQRQVPGSSTSMVCRMSHEGTVHWYMQLPGEPPKRILHMSGQQRAVADSGDSRRFKVGKNPSEPVYSLTIHSLTPRDSGTYYYGQAQVLLKQSQASITRKETRTAWIDCTTQGISDFQSALIHWYRHIPSKAPERILYIGSGQPVYDDNSNTRKYSSVKKGTNLCSFSINDINSNDEGADAQAVPVQTPEIQRQVPGSSTSMACRMSHEGTVHWYMQLPGEPPKRILYMSGQQRATADSGDSRRFKVGKNPSEPVYSLTIHSLTPRDSGTYYYGQAQVLLKQSQASITRKETRTAWIDCTTQGISDFQSAHIHWYRQIPPNAPERILYIGSSQPVSDDNSNTRKYSSVKKGTNLCSFSINDINSNDEGSFHPVTAVVELLSNVNTLQSSADAQAVPVQTPEIQRQVPGSSTSMVCRMSHEGTVHWYMQLPGEPPKRILYMSGQQRATADSGDSRRFKVGKNPSEPVYSLTIHSLTPRDSGTYYYGQAQVLLKQSQASITRKETRTAWIDCTTQGIYDFQSAFIHWYRQIPTKAPERILYIGSGQPVYDDNSNTRKYSSVKKGTNLCSFSINDINSNDEGGDAQAVPVQTPEIQRQVPGSSTSMVCRMSHEGTVHWYMQLPGEPPKRILYMSGQQSAVADSGDSRRFQVWKNPSEPVYSLTIHSLTPRDSGTYYYGQAQVLLKQSQASITRKETRTAWIDCTTQGISDFQSAHIHWYRQIPPNAPERILYIGSSQPVSDDNSNTRKYSSVKKGTNLCSFSINDINSNDEGADAQAVPVQTPEIQRQVPGSSTSMVCRMSHERTVHWYMQLPGEPPKRILYMSGQQRAVADSGDSRRFKVGKNPSEPVYSLTIHSLTPRDSGTYYYGQAQVLLKQSQASITRKETRTAWIDCTTQGISEFQSALIHWYRQIPSKAPERILYIGSGQPVYDDNSNTRKYSSVKKGTNLCSFSINDINSNDEGADAQAVPVQTPEIQRQVPGSSTSMVCRMSHEGTVHWYMQLPGEPPKRILYMSGQQRAVADSGDSRRFKVGKNPSEPVYSLTIHSLTPRDSGTYYYGQAQVLLKQSQASITRKETRTAWIDCTTQGISDFQSAFIHWYRQIPPNAPERILYIGSSQPVYDDNSNTRKYSSVKKGTNLCSFSINDINSNDEGADAQAVPVQNPEIQRQVPGSSTSMVCRMSHEGTVHWYMQLPGEPPKRILYMSGQQRATADSGDSRRFKVGKNPSEPVYSLTIHSLTPRDSGTYYCGFAQEIPIQSPISITKLKKSAQMICEIQALGGNFDGIIHWYQQKEDKAPERLLFFSGGKMVVDTGFQANRYLVEKVPDQNQYVLTIKDVIPNDAATYYCAYWDTHCDIYSKIIKAKRKPSLTEPQGCNCAIPLLSSLHLVSAAERPNLFLLLKKSS